MQAAARCARSRTPCAAARCEREPVAYIVGRRGFRALELAVDRARADPAPGDRAARRGGAGAAARARACSTSAPAAARSRSRSQTSAPTSRSSGSDLSAAALELARANARRLGLDVRWLHADLLDGRRRRASTRSLANPPYVAERERAALAPEILRHEPRGALFAGADGLARSARCSRQLAARTARAARRARGRRGPGARGRAAAARSGLRRGPPRARPRRDRARRRRASG